LRNNKDEFGQSEKGIGASNLFGQDFQDHSSRKAIKKKTSKGHGKKYGSNIGGNRGQGTSEKKACVMNEKQRGRLIFMPNGKGGSSLNLKVEEEQSVPKEKTKRTVGRTREAVLAIWKKIF